jgi:hypothetical protein
VSVLNLFLEALLLHSMSLRRILGRGSCREETTVLSSSIQFLCNIEEFELKLLCDCFYQSLLLL